MGRAAIGPCGLLPAPSKISSSYQTTSRCKRSDSWLARYSHRGQSNRRHEQAIRKASRGAAPVFHQSSYTSALPGLDTTRTSGLQYDSPYRRTYPKHRQQRWRSINAVDTSERGTEPYELPSPFPIIATQPLRYYPHPRPAIPSNARRHHSIAIQDAGCVARRHSSAESRQCPRLSRFYTERVALHRGGTV